MEVWLWAVIGIMALIVTALLIKIYFLQKAAKEIANAFADRLITDTNTLIDISCNDRYMRKLANAINVELRKLRVQQHRFQQGDTELKNAVTNISHDLRTPLTAICGYLDLLQNENKSENATRYLELIENRTQALKQLTEELFRYSVIMSAQEPLRLETVCVNRVLEESLAAFYAVLTERSISPEIEITEKQILCYVNKAALMRVFENILSNALKYSDGDLKVELLESGELIFSNTACKLNEIQVGKLFNRFFSVEAARNSAGLGLAISKALVEQMDGTISAQYKGDRLSICVAFPIAASKQSAVFLS